MDEAEAEKQQIFRKEELMHAYTVPSLIKKQKQYVKKLDLIIKKQPYNADLLHLESSSEKS